MPTIYSAGVIVACRCNKQWEVLMLRAYRNWDFPKGVLEPGEESLQAARRELREETGIDPMALHWPIDVPYETPPYKSTHAGAPVNKLCYLFLAVAQSRLPCAISPEHHAFAWHPLPRAKELVVPRLKAALAWAAVQLGP